MRHWRPEHRGAVLVTLLLVLLMGLAGALTGCGGPTSGTVIGRRDTPEHYHDWTQWIQGGCVSWVRSRNTQTCVAYQHFPIFHHDYVARRCELKLRSDDDDTKTGWRDVDCARFDAGYPIGSHYES